MSSRLSAWIQTRLATRETVLRAETENKGDQPVLHILRDDCYAHNRGEAFTKEREIAPNFTRGRTWTHARGGDKDYQRCIKETESRTHQLSVVVVGAPKIGKKTFRNMVISLRFPALPAKYPYLLLPILPYHTLRSSSKPRTNNKQQPPARIQAPQRFLRPNNRRLSPLLLHRLLRLGRPQIRDSPQRTRSSPPPSPHASNP